MASARSLLVVSDQVPWLTALAVPVAARLATPSDLPVLLVVGAPPSPEALALAERLAPQRTWLLGVSAEDGSASSIGRWAPDTLTVPAEPLPAALAVARQYWGTAAHAVVANIDESEAVLQGAAWAAVQGVPLLLYGHGQTSALKAALAELHATRVEVCTTHSQAPKLAGLSGLEYVSAHRMPQRLLARFGPERTRNLILARTPTDANGPGRTAWLAPYLTLARRAPLLLTASHVATTADKLVDSFLKAESPAAQTLTILADDDSIGHHVVRVEDEMEAEKVYKVTTEPGTATHSSQTMSLGVGRIPLARLRDASLLFARGLVRDRLPEAAPSMLLVANPSIDDWELPLCEAISRATAEEFKNCGVAVHEFYQTRANTDAVRAAARDAQLIVYQGHIEHEELFRAPRRNEKNPRSEPATTPPVSVASQTVVAPPELLRLPVVILQACDSLDAEIVWQAHAAGASAIVGTATPVHSGPGSALVKALCDGCLYRQCSVGEALRDAKNYLFCVQDLKRLRGYAEWAKTERTALSFRLFGDPELTLFAQAPATPQRPPLSAAWDNSARVVVQLPAQRLPEVRSDGYVVRLYPGSEASGLLLRLRRGNRTPSAMYFFRLAAPPGFPAESMVGAVRNGDDVERGVFRLEPQRRFLYILYLADRNTEERALTLRLRPGPLVPAPTASTTGSDER